MHSNTWQSNRRKSVPFEVTEYSSKAHPAKRRKGISRLRVGLTSNEIILPVNVSPAERQRSKAVPQKCLRQPRNYNFWKRKVCESSKEGSNDKRSANLAISYLISFASCMKAKSFVKRPLTISKPSDALGRGFEPSIAIRMDPHCSLTG